MLTPVPHSAELARVLALPTREWSPAASLALAEEWSPQLLNDYGRQLWRQCALLAPEARERELQRLADEGTPLRMKREQATICYDFLQCRGVCVNGPVGVGKTLAFWLLALLSQLHFGTHRPVIFCPGSITDDTRRAHLGFAKVWQMPRPLPRVVSYEKLGAISGEFLLCDCAICTRGEVEPTGEALQPDFIGADEADLLRNASSTTSRRWDRFQINHVPITTTATGTPVRKSLRNCNRHFAWTVKPDGAPVPGNWKDLDDWCGATDESPRDGQRRPPGALVELIGPGADISSLTPELQLEAVRRAIGSRIARTPGIVVIDESSCDEPLTIRVLEAPGDAALDAAFYNFRETDCTPDGWRLGDVFSVLRHGAQLGAGFYQFWDPRPPAWYVDARNEWNAHVKQRIEESQHTGRPIDSEGVVARRDSNLDVYRNWKAAKERFGEPNVVTRTVTLSVLSYAAQWIQINGPGLVWTQHRWVGETLSQMTGLPFFGGKGLTAGGLAIRDHNPKHSAILSTNANRRGRNLPQWNRNLVIAPEYSAERWEQQIGRTHRYGQKRPVLYDVIVACDENLMAIERALSEARNAQAVGGITQKMLSADWDWTNVSRGAREPWTVPELGRRARWTRRGA